jgi:hypothetical protein
MKMRRQARQAPSKQGSNYLQVSTTTKIAAIYSLSQQTRGASNTLPHYPRALYKLIYFLFTMLNKYEFRSTKLALDLGNGGYKLQSAIAELIIAVKETL